MAKHVPKWLRKVGKVIEDQDPIAQLADHDDRLKDHKVKDDQVPDPSGHGG